MNFSTKGIEVKDEQKVSKWLTPLKAHVAVIKNVEYFESSEKKTPGIKLTFMGKPMTELQGEGQKAEAQMWLSEAAYPYTQKTLLMIVDKMGKRDEFDNLTAEAKDAKDFVSAFRVVTQNKPMTYIFGGEEVILTNDEGEQNVWIKPTLARYGFVGSVEDFAEYNERAEKAGDKLLRKAEVPATETTQLDNTAGMEDAAW